MAKAPKKPNAPTPQVIALVRKFLKDSGFKSTSKVFKVECATKLPQRVEAAKLPTGTPSLRALFDEWAAKERGGRNNSGGSESPSDADDELGDTPDSDEEDGDEDGDDKGGEGKDRSRDKLDEETESSDTVAGDKAHSSDEGSNIKKYVVSLFSW